VKRLEGKRCLITGGSRGLGRAMAEAFASEGAKVAFTYSQDDADAEEARAAVRAHGFDPLVFKGSVADARHVTATVKALGEAWGGVDVLVNNAALTQILPIALIDEEDFDLVMDVNVKGAFLFSRAVLRSMIRARRGVILNVGNFATDRPIEAPVHYAASKAALRGLTEALAREVGRYDIRVTLLAPGLMETGLGAMLPQHRVEEYRGQCALGRLATAEEMARVAVFLVSDESAFTTAAKVIVDGGV
jgi:NAD(P)-dependent dehydrogenase (short-subunit alcohol dehydrogenase family)